MTTSKGNLLNRIRTLALAAAALIILGLVAQNLWRGHRESQVGSREVPLKFVLAPDHGQKVTPDQLRALTDFVEKECGLFLEFRVAASPLEAINAFDGERGTPGDIGLLSLFEYGLARYEYKVEASLQALRGSGASSYAGVVVVKAESSDRAVADLKGERVAYADPFSTSGFIFPVRLFADARVDVVPVFTGSHERSLAALMEGRADAAATYEEVVANDPRFRIIARTDSIPNEPLFIRAGLDNAKRASLSAAIMKFAATPEGQAVLKDMADITGFQPVTDAEYRPVFDAINAAGKTVYDVVPEGTRLEAARRQIDFIL